MVIVHSYVELPEGMLQYVTVSLARPHVLREHELFQVPLDDCCRCSQKLEDVLSDAETVASWRMVVAIQQTLQKAFRRHATGVKKSPSDCKW